MGGEGLGRWGGCGGGEGGRGGGVGGGGGGGDNYVRFSVWHLQNRIIWRNGVFAPAALEQATAILDVAVHISKQPAVQVCPQLGIRFVTGGAGARMSGQR